MFQAPRLEQVLRFVFDDLDQAKLVAGMIQTIAQDSLVIFYRDAVCVLLILADALGVILANVFPDACRKPARHAHHVNTITRVLQDACIECYPFATVVS
jgi:hypothetical protein